MEQQVCFAAIFAAPTPIPLPEKGPMKRSIALLPLTVLLLAGCAATPAPGPVATTADPITVTNCGFDLTVSTPPEKIVAIKSTSTDLLLALGLEERIVGLAFQDGEQPSELPVIAEHMPTEEALLELEPDFVFSGWESAFTPEAAGERAELADLGVGTYVAPAACKEPEFKPTRLGFDQLFDQITEAGRIFGASDAASALVAQQREQLASINADDRGLTALWWSSGDDTPYVGAGIGAPQMMMDALGLTNIAAAIDDTWSPLAWEAIVDADPDVIVLVDASWNTAAAKMATLASDPATATLSAVVNQRYLVIPFAAGEAGVRSVPATADLADQLTAL